MSVKVKSENIRSFVAIDDKTYEALKLLGANVDILGFVLLDDNEEFKSSDYKVVRREQQKGEK